MPNYLGTKTGNTGIPSLLVSSLQQVQDPHVQTALYEIQNWANSFMPFLQIFGDGGPIVGTTATAKLVQFGTDVQMTNGGSGAAAVFPKPFPNSVESIVATYGDNTMTGTGWLAVIHSQVSLTGFGWEAAGSPSQLVRINYIAIGT